MLEYIRASSAQQITADGAFGVSATATSFAWLANVNEILQFVALAIAIISGYYAARYHRRKNKELDEK